MLSHVRTLDPLFRNNALVAVQRPRTTRSVAPTEAGERLLHTIGPRFEEIEAELSALSELRETPAGTVRITATDYAADTILWPKLTKFLRRYPEKRPFTC